MNRSSSLSQRDVKYTYNRQNEKKKVEKERGKRSKKEPCVQTKKRIKNDTLDGLCLANDDSQPDATTSHDYSQDYVTTNDNSQDDVTTSNDCESNYNENNAYIAELVRTNAVVPLRDDFTAFCMQKWIKNKLHNKNFVIVERHPKSFSGIMQWVYTCDCNPSRKKLIDSLDKDIKQHYREVFVQKFADCIHIQCLETLLRSFDEANQICIDDHTDYDHIYSKTKHTVNVFPLPNHESMVCILCEESYGIVDISSEGKTKFTCSKCRKYECLHIRSLKALLSDCDAENDVLNKLKSNMSSEKTLKDIYIQTSVSKQKIPFDQKSSTVNVTNTLANNMTICSCGTSAMEEVRTENLPLMFMDKVCHITVSTNVCSKCLKKAEYDGNEDSILNMGTYLVHHNLLRDYMRTFLTEGTTMYAYYKMLKWRFIDGNYTLDEFTYQRFRAAWYSFIELLDINYESGFSCPQCGSQPETVIMDGITLGFKEVHLPWFKFLSDKAVSMTFDGSMHGDRVFIKNKTARQLLYKYSSQQSTGLPQWEFNELERLLAIHQPSLLKLLQETSLKGSSELYRADHKIQNFVLALSKDSPLCGLFHHSDELLNILEKLANDENISNNALEMKMLMEEVPVLFQIVSSCSTIPTFLKPVIQSVINIVKKTYETPIHELPKCSSSDELAYFPSMPKLCERGQYTKDQERVHHEISSDCEKLKFLKRRKGHPTLIPGIFTVLCPHGVCYGFRVMENAESPNVPFTILRTRFKKAPKYVIYDNACHLMSYCLNRDPSFFKDSWFLVDRFHWKNHKGCSEGFNLSIYPHLQELNSQAAEQRNSYLVKLKPMLSYMNFRSFMAHLILFSWFISMSNKSKLFYQDDIQYIDYFKKIIC